MMVEGLEQIRGSHSRRLRIGGLPQRVGAEFWNFFFREVKRKYGPKLRKVNA
jgi:hypothetical protein